VHFDLEAAEVLTEADPSDKPGRQAGPLIGENNNRWISFIDPKQRVSTWWQAD